MMRGVSLVLCGVLAMLLCMAAPTTATTHVELDGEYMDLILEDEAPAAEDDSGLQDPEEEAAQEEADAEESAQESADSAQEDPGAEADAEAEAEAEAEEEQAGVDPADDDASADAEAEAESEDGAEAEGEEAGAEAEGEGADAEGEGEGEGEDGEDGEDYNYRAEDATRGPAAWANIKAEYSACNGNTQSPINLAASKTNVLLPMLQPRYVESELELTNDGNFLTVSVDEGSKLVVGDDGTFDLVSLLVRTPAEHQVDGKTHDAELQLVHVSEGGRIVMVSVLLEEGGENAFLRQFLRSAPAGKGAQKHDGGKVSPAGALPKSFNYFKYGGSLSTPPCSENVVWYVYRETAPISAEQLDKLRGLFPAGNARPVQPVNNRTVEHTEFVVSSARMEMAQGDKIIDHMAAGAMADELANSTVSEHAEYAVAMNAHHHHAAAAATAEAVRYSYTHAHTGPDAWGHLRAEWSACARGTHQSPVDIVRTQMNTALPRFDVSGYKPTEAVLVNNGNQMHMKVGSGSVLVHGYRSYQLRDVVFHTPSEHQINGNAVAMEMQLVHEAEDGSALVVALLMEEGSEDNAFLAPFWGTMPTAGREYAVVAGAGAGEAEAVRVNFADALPADKNYYAYQGSQSVPPCEEGVQWLVLKNPATVSPAQLERVQHVVRESARPVQRLNDRFVQSSALPTDF